MRSVTNTPVHVLEVIGNVNFGGVENHVMSLAQHLPEFGVTVTCLAPYESAYTARLRNLGVDVFLTEMDLRIPWRSIQFAHELILQHEIDVVHSHLPRAHLLAGLAARLAQRPAVATFHGMEIGMDELSIAGMTGMTMIAVCQQAYSQALALGIPPEMVNLIPNGVDLKKFSPSQAGISFRQQHKIPPDALLAGFAGRLSFEKGPDQFVQMALIAHQSRPDIHFAMVGDGPMREEMRAQVHQSGLDEVFHITGFGEAMETIYPASDLLVMTSRIEGMPLAVLEAMACGIPTVTMPTGGLREAVEVGTTGLTAAPDDVQGLARALLILADDPDRMKEMGHAARRRVEEQFGLPLRLSRLSGVFRALTGYALLQPGSALLEPADVRISEKQLHAKRKGQTNPAAVH